MRTSSTRNSLIIGISIVLGASLLSVGVSNAAGSTIKACAKKSGGAMRLIDSNKKCSKNERTLTWGAKGDAGAAGSTGATGAAGATGATGAAGSNGTNGAAGSNGTNGTNGTNGNNGASYATYKVFPQGIGELSTSNEAQTLARLTGLTPGNYLLNATVEVSNVDLIGFIRCRFYIPVSYNGSYSSSPIKVLFLSPTDIQDQITANYAVENLPGGAYDSVIFECYVNGGDGQSINYQYLYLSATKVDTLVRQ